MISKPRSQKPTPPPKFGIAAWFLRTEIKDPLVALGGVLRLLDQTVVGVATMKPYMALCEDCDRYVPRFRSLAASPFR